MCYDISCQVNIRELADYFPGLVFDGQLDLEFGPVDHVQGVAVFSKYPIIYLDRNDQKPHCRLMEWGVIAHYAKQLPAIPDRNKWVNIRSERVLDDTSSYWHKIRNRRCLIPVTGIYEHRAIRGWKKKVPYWIRPIGQNTFFLPGLYSVWEEKDVTGQLLQKKWTFGMITRAGNELLRMIHNDGENRYRMPLFLPFDMAKEFLSEELSNQDDRYRELLNYEMPADALEYHPVWTIRTGKLRPDNKPSKSDYFEWENLPPLGELMPE